MGGNDESETSTDTGLPRGHGGRGYLVHGRREPGSASGGSPSPAVRQFLAPLAQPENARLVLTCSRMLAGSRGFDSSSSQSTLASTVYPHHQAAMDRSNFMPQSQIERWTNSTSSHRIGVIEARA